MIVPFGALTLAIVLFVSFTVVVIACARFGLWRVIKMSAGVCLAMVAFAFVTLLGGCDRGPTEEDMAGCASTRYPTMRDVAECAVERDRK